MQYLLTEPEYRDMVDSAKSVSEEHKKTLQEVCILAANNVPVLPYGRKGNPVIWGCILTTDDFHCCDECPVKKQCPNEHKVWSK